MITLRDGSKVEDARFNRLEQFDERSRNFPITAIIEKKKHRSYTWRCNQVLNQGPDGACVGFGISHELIARPSEVKGLTYRTAFAIYHAAQKIDPWEGGSYPGASPHYEGTSVLSGIKIAKNQGYFNSYRWAFGIEDLILGVGHNGPAVLGIPWLMGMNNPNVHGYISATGRKLGGHCILCMSVNVKEERFTLHNSWGSAWGMYGKCYINFSDMDLLLKDRGEAVFCLKRHTKPQV